MTYIKAEGEIRTVFAETVEARTRNDTAVYFSFNTGGGRCQECEGEGYTQFLAGPLNPYQVSGTALAAGGRIVGRVTGG